MQETSKQQNLQVKTKRIIKILERYTHKHKKEVCFSYPN